MKHRCAAVATALGLLVAVAYPASAAAQAKASGADTSRLREALRKGKELRSRNELSGAINEFEAARKEAARIGDRSDQANAALQAAQTHQELFLRNTKQVQHLEKAMANYEAAIELGGPEQRAEALNNLGTLYLTKKDYPAAIRALKRVDMTQIPPKDRFIYDYNLGRAYDLSGNPSDAFPLYVSALAANPNYSPAALRAFENLRSAGPPQKFAETLGLADRLLKHAQSELAARETFRCLQVWGDDLRAVELLPVLVRHYTIASVEPERFRKEMWPALNELASQHPKLKPAIEELRLAFESDFKPVIKARKRGLFELFPVWSKLGMRDPLGERTFPSLLKLIGDYYYESVDRSGECRDPGKALARYSAAWSMDPFNTEAALFTAAVLRDYAEKLDPDHQLYNQFVENIFDLKNGVYAKQPKSPADRANLVRMHFLLGSIFEREGNWGSEDNPRSAVFQWVHAIRQENKLREVDPRSLPTPGLHQHLAMAYQLSQEPAKAFEQFLIAAEEFAELNDMPSAKDALASARGLDAAPGPDRQERIQRLAARLGSASAIAATVGGRNADSIVDKAILALGGEERLSKIGAYSVRSKVTIAFGDNHNEFTSKATLLGLDRYRSEFEGRFGDDDVKGTIVVNGEKGWRKFGDAEMELDGDAFTNEKRTIYLSVVPSLPIYLKGKGFKTEAAGEEKVGDKPASVVKVTGPDGKDFKLWFDKESGLPVKLVVKLVGFDGNEFTQETSYANYKNFDGIMRATKVTAKRDGEAFVSTEVTEFKLLGRVEANTFSQPR
jgi:tetratricopeptide (TPR) repeat protein